MAAVAVSVVTLSMLGAGPAMSGTDGRPGVTRTEIRVGGVASRTGNAGIDYASAFVGVDAYFDKINNEEDGVFGRKLRLVKRVDDRGAASRNAAANRRLARRGKVFAVLPEATRNFLGADQLVLAGVPTFGWATGPEWARGPNLFGDVGSYSCLSCPAIAPAFVASQLGVKRVAVLSPATAQVVNCGSGMRAGFEHYGFEVVLTANSLDVDVVRDRGVELITTCQMPFAQVRRITRALDGAGLESVRVYADAAYDPAALDRAGEKLDGLIVSTRFVPWEVPRSSPGTRAFLDAMRRRKQRPTLAAQAGWINAALLVEGIKAAGPEFTQQSVVDAINAMTTFRADGMLPGINWTLGGHGPGREQCAAFVEAANGRFELRYARPGRPFVCFPDNPVPASLLEPVLRPT